MCKHVVKRVPYLIRYVSDQYKTQQMCDMAILANGGTLTSVSDCYKNQEMCNTVDNYHHALYFVPECYKSKKCVIKLLIFVLLQKEIVPECFIAQEMSDKAFNSYFFYLILFLIGIKLKNCVIELILIFLFW